MREDNKYGLVWDQEREPETCVKKLKNSIPYLKEVEELTIKGDEGKPHHVLIEGDNYHSLTVLQTTHEEKIDIIYIDPPYNTGRGFTYSDKKVDKDDTYKHSKWLNFMNARLLLAKKLLKKDGIIYISIGHQELANLTLLCDKVFGVQNRITIMSRITKFGKDGMAKSVTNNCDYILMYAKLFNDNIKKSLGLTYPNDYSYDKTLLKTKTHQIGDNDRYWIKCPDNTYVIPKGENYPEKVEEYYKSNKVGLKERGWVYANTSLKDKLDNEPFIKINVYTYKKGFLTFYKNKGNGSLVNEKREESNWSIKYNKKPNGLKPIPNFLWDDKFSSEHGSRQLKNMFDEELIANAHLDKMQPKTSELITHLIKITNKENNITILDFFAGSGTTGHAVIDMNAKDGGTRQSIMCAINDEEDKVDICSKITYERLKQVTFKWNKSKKEFDGTGEDLFDKKDVSSLDGFPPTLKYFKIEFTPNIDPLTRIMAEEANKEALL